MRWPTLALAALALLTACGEREGPPLPGERLALRSGTFQNAVPQAGPRALLLPAPEANADWTHRGGAPDHALGHVALGGSLQPLFSVPIGEGNSRRARITGEPVVAGGRVFALDARDTVTALSTGGAALWSRSVLPVADQPTDASGGGLASDGASVFVSTGYGRVTALDAATGTPRWTQDLDAPGSSSPTILGEIVLIVARDGRAWALEAATGRIRWTEASIPTASTWAGGAGAAARDGLVVVPFPSGEVLGVFPEGGLRRWETIVAGNRPGSAASFAATDIGGDPVLEGGTVYVGTYSGRLAALSADTGETLWAIPEGAASPAVPAGDSLFLVNDVNDLLRVDAATGGVIWRTDLPEAQQRRGVTAHIGPILAGGRLIVASSDGALRQFDPATGASLGDVALASGAASAPVVAGGVLYVVTEDGRLNAFR